MRAHITVQDTCKAENICGHLFVNLCVGCVGNTKRIISRARITFVLCQSKFCANVDAMFTVHKKVVLLHKRLKLCTLYKVPTNKCGMLSKNFFLFTSYIFLQDRTDLTTDFAVGIATLQTLHHSRIRYVLPNGLNPSGQQWPLRCTCEDHNDLSYVLVSECALDGERVSLSCAYSVF